MKETDTGSRQGRELSVIDFGEEKCSPRHSFGPAVRPYYLIHYVLSGKGIFSEAGQDWEVGPGQAFLIYPGEVTVYRADARQPWHYAWVGFSGEAAADYSRLCGFERKKRVLVSPHPGEAWQALLQLRLDAAGLRLGKMAALGGLCRFLSLLAPVRDESNLPEHALHYEKALWYMRGAFSLPITVQEIADFVGISRSQLFRVFEKSCSQSPKQVLQEMRLEQARSLLDETSLSLEQIACSSGLGSGGQFSTAFRARYGLPPRQYRKQEKLEKAPAPDRQI